ncbi:MAG: hypothetical protein Q9171_003190 [Xanthocarpia ochracea]
MTFVSNEQLQDLSAANPQRPSAVDSTSADASGGYVQALSNTGPPVIRRFGRLSARVALLMQNRIVHLESVVHAEDAKWIKGNGDNGSFDLDPSKERQNAMDELVWRLEQYRESVINVFTTAPMTQSTKQRDLCWTIQSLRQDRTRRRGRYRTSKTGSETTTARSGHKRFLS